MNRATVSTTTSAEVPASRNAWITTSMMVHESSAAGMMNATARAGTLPRHQSSSSRAETMMTTGMPIPR